MARNDQVTRILNVLSLLEGSPTGFSVTELHGRLKEREFTAEKRTIYRDLDALSQAGFPLKTVEGETTDTNAQRWVLDRTARINDYLVLSARELFALYLAKGLLKPLENTLFFDSLSSIFSKIEDKLGTRGQEYFAELSSEMRFEPWPKWGLGTDPDTIETVRTACAEGQQLKLTYTSASKNETRERFLGPHYLYIAKGGAYLLAEDLTDKKVKVFALPRIQNAELMPDEYKGEVQDPAKYFEHSLGVYRADEAEEIELEFLPSVAAFAKERQWHPSQRVVKHSDGKIRMKLEVGVTPELVGWILSFGAEVTILSGSKLISEVAKTAKDVANKYIPKKAA